MRENQDGGIEDDRVSELIWMGIAERAFGGGGANSSRDQEFEERATEMIQKVVYGAAAFLARRKVVAISRAELNQNRQRYYC